MPCYQLAKTCMFEASQSSLHVASPLFCVESITSIYIVHDSLYHHSSFGVLTSSMQLVSHEGVGAENLKTISWNCSLFFTPGISQEMYQEFGTSKTTVFIQVKILYLFTCNQVDKSTRKFQELDFLHWLDHTL